MKKIVVSVITTLIVLFLIAQNGWLEPIGVGRFDITFGNANNNNSGDDASMYQTQDGISYRVKAQGNNFFFFEKGKWQKKFIKGVNIGAGEPGIFPGELSISYEDYYRWFGYISKMGANSIRVYTTLRPQFYNALRDFNEHAKNPLYIFQGIWMNEEDINLLADVYAENNKIYNEFSEDAKNAIDVIHGNITLPERAGFASGEYTADVSKYFAGWIVGIEWDPKFVKNTNDNNKNLDTFDGKYLYTLNATPFEAFLCRVGNEMIEYETSTYKFQSPIGFSNWITTDPLHHPNEPHPDEDLLTVNMENIKSRNAFLPNQFISYHIYPYYPDSLNYQKDYLDYVDETGKVNTYRAYLKDLKLAHTMPILVAEFGIPASRGMGHKSVMGYNQGHVDETKSGAMILDMFNSMYKENYAGGLIFTWQDEWFKRTWNNVKFDIPDDRPFWFNVQTCEQAFGLLAFDPGKNSSVCYVDGNADDWGADVPLTTNENGSLSMKSDEAYVYFKLNLKNYDFNKDTLLIPIDTIQNQGNYTMNKQNASFDKAADFVMKLNGANDSRIVVDSYYDVFYYLYGQQYKMLKNVKNIKKKNSGRFNNMNMCYGYEMTIPPKKTKIPFKSFETGKLQFGIGNPKLANYQSLSDFYYKNGILEIKIPWQLLNVMDPSSKKIMDNFYELQNIAPTNLTDFNVGFAVQKPKTSVSVTMNGTFGYKGWKIPTYHERLKPAYYDLQKGLKSFN